MVIRCMRWNGLFETGGARRTECGDAVGAGNNFFYVGAARRKHSVLDRFGLVYESEKSLVVFDIKFAGFGIDWVRIFIPYFTKMLCD